MATIHSSEWLDQAKKVPVGQKRRVYHGAEMTPAMDVWNNEDSWSCYCHRCHAGGKVYKQFLQRVNPEQPVYRKYLNTKDLITIDELYSTDKLKYKRLMKLLHDKGMSMITIAALKPMYNKVDDRLVFRFKGVDIGRDCTGLHGAKWLVYHSDNPSGYVYLQGKNPYCTREPVILCEDLFSAQKVRYYTGWSSLFLMGTNFKDETAHFLMSRLPVIATDGDAAGWAARKVIRTRCEMFNIPVQSVGVPVGLDPKDMKPMELINLFKHLENPDGY